MYVQHFGLEHEPFSIAPDPRYLYLSEHHREALAHLLYGLDGGGGFVLLTGEIGAGKTTVCRCFLEQVPAHCQVAYIFNPKLTVVELLGAVCEEFGIDVPNAVNATAGPTVKSHIDPLNRFLLDAHAAGRNCVLVIDEAQQLSAEVLEQLRLLTNLETSERKLLQIILVGQPELRDMLAQPGLEQLAQRVIARYHLGRLNEVETGYYLQHRLSVAGLKGATPLGTALVRRIHRLSDGVPRRINLLCDRALLGAYSQGRTEVDDKTLVRAAQEIGGQHPGSSAGESGRGWLQRPHYAAIVAATLVVLWLGAYASGWRPGGSGASRVSVASAASSVRAAAVSTPTSASASPNPGVALLASTAAPATRPPSVQAAELRRLLRLHGQDEVTAWRRLAPRWNLTVADGEPCAAAALRQVNCYRGVGGLALVRQLDRPGVMVLRNGDVPPTHVLLIGLDPQYAWLQVGPDSWSVPLTELANWWRGDYATFWRAPVGADGGALPADGGLSAWVSDRLGDLGPPAAGASAASPDKPLRTRLLGFQVSQGLDPDGLLGPLTVMALNRSTGVAEPRLSARP